MCTVGWMSWTGGIEGVPCNVDDVTEDGGKGVVEDGLGVDVVGLDGLTEAAVGVVDGDVKACEFVDGVDALCLGVGIGCGV